MDNVANETGWRGSAEAWLEAAYELLLESGVDAVKVQPLAKRLGLSRTSFYWFFEDRDALLAALIARWRDKNTGALLRQSQAYAENIIEAVLNIFDCWIDPQLFDSRFEFSVRSWAIQSQDILNEVREADRLRIDALSAMFVRFGYHPTTADVRARTTYLVQIGYITMQHKEDVATRLKRIPDYIQIYTGLTPEQRDLDRFYARHMEQKR